MTARLDRRAARTRTALVEAFNHLVLNRRRATIRVADIVELAQVGRSTFYEHYAGAEAIYLEALARPFGMLAAAAAGQGDEARLAALLAHFWENRQRGRETLSGRLGEKAARLLAGQIEVRLEARNVQTVVARRLAAVQLADAALAPVRAWIGGEAPCSSQMLARSLCRTGQALTAALTAAPSEPSPLAGEGQGRASDAG